MQTTTLDVIAGLNPEEEQEPEKKVEVVRTPELERILKGFEQVLKSTDREPSRFRFVPKRIPAAIITTASVALGVYSTEQRFPWHAGIYLTALVNGSPDEEHTLFLNGYSQPPEWIGYELRKRLTVHGTTGNFGGYENHGELILVGNTSHLFGYFNKGKIVLNGDVGNHLGGRNEGRITINGNAGESFSLANMGTIWLYGIYKSLGFSLGSGDIHHNGNRIVKDGERLV